MRNNVHMAIFIEAAKAIFPWLLFFFLIILILGALTGTILFEFQGAI